MPNWTKSQLAAIVDRGKNLLVSAAAGSGKTAVLVERIIRLIIEDKIDIDKLLIVTFTNAAAGEMRERILQALTEAIEKGIGNEEDLRRQITLLNKASITTVHSFCINVVRRNFHLIGIDPTFRIGDATETNIIIQDVLEELLEQEYEKADDNFITLVEGFGGNKNDEKLESLILKIYGFIQSKPYPEEWLRESVESFNMTKEKFEESQWMDTIRDSIKIELSGAKDLINEAISLAKGINGPIEYLDALYDDLNNIDELNDIMYKQVLEAFIERLNNISHARLKRVSKEVDDVLKKEAQRLRDKYKNDIINKSLKSGLLSKDMDQYLKEIKSLYPTMKYLYNLIVFFSEMYTERKLEKGILDFSDLEHYTLKVLESEEVSKEFRDKFDYIFIDEYQDSNIVQETIINRIKRDNNLFFVGDVKQSIYRFRLADPSLFLEKYNKYKYDACETDKRIDLSQNFRSRVEILDGVNYIFKNIMSEQLGEVEYKDDAYLNKGAEYKDIENPTIELNLIEKQTEIIDDLEEELEEMADIEVEARIIASRIRELIGKETYDIKLSQYRKISFKDIVVLLRATKNWSTIFTEAFMKEGIPVYADDNTGYFDVLEVKIFLNLLNIIDNKRQDIPLLSVMRSSIGKFTTEELIKVRLNYKNGTYYEAIEKYIIINSDELSERLSKFLSTIDYWSEESRYLKMDEFIWKLMIETGYYHYVGAMPGGIQRQANLRILVDRACHFESTSVNGLFNFIRFVDKLKSSSGDLGTAKTLSESENVIRIMSIHKSKGLEFPVVICAGLGKGFNLMDARDDILLHKDLGLGPKYVDIIKRRYTETLPQLAIKKKMKLESLSEEMRILYVALTRPKDKLILVGSVRNIENQCKRWCRGTSLYNLTSSRSYMDWICSSLSKHQDGETIRKLGNVQVSDESIDIEDSSKWTIKILNRGDVIRQEADDILDKKEKRDILENFTLQESSGKGEEISRRFSWSYNYKDAIKIPSKMAVSDIKKASFKNLDSIVYKIPSLVKMPKFLEGNKSFTSAEKGTIIHHVMQHLDITKVNERHLIEEQIDRMVLNELLTDEEVKVVNVDKIVKFFDSQIGKRIISCGQVYREQPFVLNKKAKDALGELDNCEEDLLVQGIIDCYFQEEDGLVLIDYKTDSLYTGELDNLVQKYKPQLQLYKEALERITKKKVKEIYIYSFELDKEINVE